MKTLFCLVWTFIFGFSAHAFDQARTVKINLESQYLFSTKQLGQGVKGEYQFNLSPVFAIGIEGAAVYHYKAPSTTKLQYGLTLNHKLQSLAFGGFIPFVKYGLLMQATMIQSRPSYAFSHDSLFGAGLLFNWGEQDLFVSLDYHYNRIKFFEQTPVKMDHIALGIGAFWGWTKQ